LNCERKHPLGQASTDVPLTVYSVKKAEPVQEPVLVVEREPDYWSGGHFHEGSRSHIDPTKVWGLPIGTKLYTTPPQRKPPATIDEMFDRMDKAPKGVFFGHDPMTIWMEAWRAAEQQHGIT
jgi:hypothetical protein